MNGVGVIPVVLRRARYVGGNDMDFLAAKASVNLVEPDGRTTLGGKKKLSQNQVSVLHGGFQEDS